MQPPENVTALQHFLGMINNLGKFIPNLSELSAPLVWVDLQKKWCWFKQHQDTFDNLKHKISSPHTLKYYDIKNLSHSPAMLLSSALELHVFRKVLQSPTLHGNWLKHKCIMHKSKKNFLQWYLHAPNSTTTYMVKKFPLKQTTSRK